MNSEIDDDISRCLSVWGWEQWEDGTHIARIIIEFFQNRCSLPDSSQEDDESEMQILESFWEFLRIELFSEALRVRLPSRASLVKS